MKTARIILIGLAALVLVACSSGQGTALTAPTEPTTAQPAATLAASASVTPSPTASATATRTVTPSATPSATASPTPTNTPSPTATPTPTHPMMVEVMRRRDYPGGELVIESVVEHRGNYTRNVASYPSDGNTIYALLTIPDGDPPPTGWPVILFNHGYIPPTQYTTTGRYIWYVDVFARNGYIVLQSDYRGHGESEGVAESMFTSPGYTVDVLNALGSLATLPQADLDRVGIWGHSMGGEITLRAMVVSDEIKAGVIWAGMVASPAEMLSYFEDRGDAPPSGSRRSSSRANELAVAYGSPQENPAFWDAISPTSFLDDLSGPVQLHHSDTDSSVPIWYSERLTERLEAAGAPFEYYAYVGDNHNLSESFVSAMSRSLAFFDEHVKGDSALETPAPETETAENGD